MIKLTLHQSSSAQTFLFTKDCIIIGEGNGDNVDISLKGLGLHQNHLKIFINNGHFYISNQANDPFVTLNGLPFGKKKIQVQDTIHIKDCTIIVDDLHIESIQEIVAPQPVDTTPIEEQICDFPSAEKLSKEDDLEGWFPSDLSELNIEDIAKIDEQKHSAHKDDACPLEEAPEKKPKSPFLSFRKLKWFAGITCLLLIVATAIGVETYLRAASKSGIEESKAAENLADLSMALTYAKVFHIIPQNHNYAEPEFLKTNLTALLPPNANLASTIDSQGLFTNCAYLFRFYSDQSLSRFLIIAQPAPSISQWLFPKDAILIDSNLMDLRKISDLKTLNSLLAASKPFEGANGRELSEVVKSLKVLSLPQLAKNAKKSELAPPRILKYLRPGAENFIYNAPRYFLFTESLLHKLLAHDLTSENAAMLENEVERFSMFDSLVIYSPDGLQTASKANKILYSLNRDINFLTGYLLLSATEEILSSRLIIETKDPLREQTPKLENDSEIAELEKSDRPLPFTHPLNKKFEEFRKNSQEILQPLLKQMAEILEESIQRNDLKEEFFLILDNYQTARLEQKRNLERLLQRIEQKYPEMNSLEIYQYLKSYQLEHLAEDWEKRKHQLSFLIETPLLPKKQKISPPFL